MVSDPPLPPSLLVKCWWRNISFSSTSLRQQHQLLAKLILSVSFISLLKNLCLPSGPTMSWRVQMMNLGACRALQAISVTRRPPPTTLLSLVHLGLTASMPLMCPLLALWELGGQIYQIAACFSLDHCMLCVCCMICKKWSSYCFHSHNRNERAVDKVIV